MTRFALSRAGVLPLAALLAACGQDPMQPPIGPTCADYGSVGMPALGSNTELEVATWNIEWFGHTSFGPTDEVGQRCRVMDVISSAGLDIWAVQEIVDAGAFATLLDSLPGYSGVLASDASVASGPQFYHSGEQKVGLIWRDGSFQPQSSRLVRTDLDFEFAGRPPLEVQGQLSIDGVVESVVFVVLHAKAFADAPSRDRREAGANGLKDWLDTTWPTTKVFVLGDFNDDIDSSITSGSPSPYASFVADSASWAFVTDTLSSSGIGTTTGFPDAIDHILVTDEAAVRYRGGSAQAYPLDQLIPGYDSSVTDHFPVIAAFLPG